MVDENVGPALTVVAGRALTGIVGGWLILAVTGLAGIKVIACVLGMETAVGGIRPAGITMIFGHNHLNGMTFITKSVFAMTGYTILFIRLGFYSMVIAEVQRMCFPIQIVTLVTLLTIKIR